MFFELNILAGVLGGLGGVCVNMAFLENTHLNYFFLFSSRKENEKPEKRVVDIFELVGVQFDGLVYIFFSIFVTELFMNCN